MGIMGYEDWYARISAPFRTAARARALDALDRGLVWAIAAAYLVSLGWLALTGDGRVWKALLVPAATFALVTVVRSALDAPRPYARGGIDPILVKERTGKSFPSRHVSSAVAIACALMWLNPLAGAVALAACAVVAFTRIVGGVHYPRDVAAAAAISLACAAIGFLIVP